MAQGTRREIKASTVASYCQQQEEDNCRLTHIHTQTQSNLSIWWHRFLEKEKCIPLQIEVHAIANGQMDWLHSRGQIEPNTRDTPVLSCIANWSYYWIQRLILWPCVSFLFSSKEMKMNSGSQRKKRTLRKEGKNEEEKTGGKNEGKEQDKGTVITINVMMGRTWHTHEK